MTGELVVVAADLRARAAAIAGTDWPDYPQDHLEAPCHIQPAQDALLNLAGNYLVLASHAEAGKQEGARLSETLTNVAIAYDTLDKDAADAVERGGPAPAPVQVAPGTPMPPGQVPHLAALGAPDPGEGDVPLTDRQLKAGDQGASLTAAATACATQAARLKAMSESYKVNDLNWEGDAAEAADARFKAFKDWIDELADSYTTLADEANKVLQAHEKARETHDPIAARYNELVAELQQLSTQPSVDPHRVQQIFDQMTKLNDESQQVRNAYAGQATTTPVQPDPVPTGSIGPASVSTNEHPRSNTPPGVGPGSTGGGGNGGSGGSGGGATGATGAMMPDSAGIQNAAQTTGTGESGGTGSGGGSAGGGGSPSGSGSPSGAGAGVPGGLPGGLPDGGTGMPTLPDDPSLRPAASGGGGSGGGGGGGVPSMPLQPSLGGSAVGPGPAGGAAGGGAGPVAASANGGMGGMAGGAPMHGAGHGQGGKEKKRNPGLSPDENIYAEERPWTEPVIGNRRRKDVADTSKESK